MAVSFSASWTPFSLKRSGVHQTGSTPLTEVTKIGKRIEDIRAQNAISRKDFYRVLKEVGRVVDLEIDRQPDLDLDTADRLKEAIVHGWKEIRLS